MRKKRSFSPILRWSLLIIVGVLLVDTTESQKNVHRRTRTLNSLQGCHLRINEIGGNLADGLGQEDFLELRAVCENEELDPGGAGLYGYRVILISSKTINGLPGSIIGVVHLQNKDLSDQGYFTIAGSKIASKSMDWKDSSVTFRNPETGRTKSMFFSKERIDGDSEHMPYGIAIVRTTGLIGEQSKLSLKERNLERPLTPELERIISEQIDDFVVYNSKTQVNKCSLFGRLAPMYAHRDKFILRSYSRRINVHESSGPLCSPRNLVTPNRRKRGVSDKKKGKNAAGSSSGQRTIDGMFGRRQTTSNVLQSNPASNNPPPPSSSSGGGASSSTSSSSSTNPASNNPPPPSSTSGGGASSSTSSSSSTNPASNNPPPPSSTSGGGASSSTSSSSSTNPASNNPPPPSSTSGGATPPSTTILQRLSISRCTELVKGFFPESFKISKPTPHEENSCDSAISPIMMAYAPELWGSTNASQHIPLSSSAPELLQGGCTLDFGSNAIDNVEVLSTDEVENVATVAINTICTYKNHDSNIVSFLDNDEIFQTDDRTRRLRHRLCSSPSASTSTASDNNANNVCQRNVEHDETLRRKYDEMISLATEHQKNKVPIQFIKNNWDSRLQLKTWLDYLPNPHDPSNSKFRCKLCNAALHNPLIPKPKTPPHLAKDEGHLWDNVESFRVRINEHVHKEMHKAAVAAEAQQEERRIEAAVGEQNKKEIAKLGKEKTATAKMLICVFAESRMYIPFSSHPKLMKLFRRLDIHSNLNFNHHLDEHGAARMATHISEELHKGFLQYLTSQDRPLSILIDTATDNQGNDFLAVIFQTLQNDYPTEFFFRLLCLEVDVTASGYLNAIKNAMDADSRQYGVPDLWLYLKRNLKGIITDGASVMTGRTGGFAVKLSIDLFGEENKGQSFKVHCSCHRLQLLTRHVVDGVPELRDFENQLRSLAVFYNAQHAKNYAHIVALSKVEKLPLRAITYIFPTRWTSNANLVLTRMIVNLPLMILDMPAISEDITFAQNTRDEARGYSNVLGNLDFHALLYFLADIIDQLNYFTSLFQRAGSVLVGTGRLYEQLTNVINVLETNYGTASTKFLKSLRCRESALQPYSAIMRANLKPGTAWEKVDKMQDCKWKYHNDKPELDLGRRHVSGSHTRAHTSGTSSPGRFDALRKVILNKMRSELEKYFPEDELYLSFDKLDPKQFDGRLMQARQYGVEAVERLAERFDLDKAATTTEFRNFMYQVASSPKFSDYNKMSPKTFWPQVLRDSSFTMGPNFRKLIRIVLVIPPGTASVERVFSVMKHTKNPRRSRLSAGRLDSLLRISLNGPDDLDVFNAEHMANTWRGHQTGSDRYRRKRTNPESVDTAAGIPHKIALTTQSQDLQQQDALQREREEDEARRIANEEYEIDVDRHANQGPLFAFDDDDMLPDVADDVAANRPIIL